MSEFESVEISYLRKRTTFGLYYWQVKINEVGRLEELNSAKCQWAKLDCLS